MASVAFESTVDMLVSWEMSGGLETDFAVAMDYKRLGLLML